MGKKLDIDWKKLGFDYIKTDYRYVSYFKDGKWDNGKLTEDNMLKISEAAPVLHYGQSCFEGLKAYRTKSGKVQLFRPNRNSARMNDSCDRLLMPRVPEEKFIDAIMQVVKANIDYVPPYGTGATLYIRPILLGVGDNIGVKPASEYIFTVFCMPVGPYFSGGLKPCNFIVQNDYDRAAPLGTGRQKVGGNYAASLMAHAKASKAGYADCIYLDPATHTKIDEVGAANFIGITKNNEFVTPKSPSILPSVTKYSLLYIAEHYLHMPTYEREVFVDKLDEFKEAGACGTAAVITPIGAIQYHDKRFVFGSETEVQPTIKKLYDILYGIQLGDVEAPEGWIYEVK
ncbi:branched-chain amino acid aminotransferase [Clostridium sp. BJN0001]|uniref:branched-chain amino acid aminotransferase n=1 Tax=Clostridium sp. BJN0001 TaxID=2930219 RepID=UPI001FD0B4DC|nr:branched-chain amino acid aminotransferase [Clostridium sp. BJN0001]